MAELDKYKQAVVDKYLDTDSNLFIDACPGGGKSYLLLQLLKRTPTTKKCIFLAFNKSIADELKTKVPLGVEVSTIHSKSLGILRRNVPLNIKVSELKDFPICKKIFDFDKLGIQGLKQQNSFIFKMIDIYRAMRLNLAFDSEGIKVLCERYGFDVNDLEIESLLLLLKENELMERNMDRKRAHSIDFTDMLYLTWKYVQTQDYPKYDVVCLDEAQDVNVLQREIVLNLLKKNGRLITVGDSKQAIYNFQFSNLDTFNYIKNRPNTISLPLSTTYRCAKKIVEEAKKVFPEGIEAVEGAPEGIVRNGKIIEVENGDYVICRNNLPLIQAYITLLGEKKRATILGKDLENALMGILEKVETVKDLNHLKLDKINNLRAKGIGNPKKHPSYVDLEEKCEIVSLLSDIWGTVEKINQNLHTLFDEKDNSVTLCTIHKSKGLEAKRIFFLDKSLLPSKFAETSDEIYAEKCLLFVAITRAINELIYCESPKEN